MEKCLRNDWLLDYLSNDELNFWDNIQRKPEPHQFKPIQLSAKVNEEKYMFQYKTT